MSTLAAATRLPNAALLFLPTNTNCSSPSSSSSGLPIPSFLNPKRHLHNNTKLHYHGNGIRNNSFIIISSKKITRTLHLATCTKSRTTPDSSEKSAMDCVGTGNHVECNISSSDSSETDKLLSTFEIEASNITIGAAENENDIQLLLWEWALLISPFFFWGTAMVAMKEVLPKAGPFFVATFRLIPAGLLLVAFATSKGRQQPSGTMAWLSISLFALVDAACFQGFLAQGLQKTSAGLGSVIIDSQPLTVAVLATLFFGESIGVVGVAGLVLGVIGLLLLEVPVVSFEGNEFSIWGSGEWWMLLAAQSMAVGTVMVRWVSKYSDPIMATGWHMVIGGVPLLMISVVNHDPAAMNGSLTQLNSTDILALLYTSIFGSAISYGVYFYNATRGSLTKLSSLTFLTPMFASIFGFLYLGETFSSLQLVGALVTVGSIYLVNYRGSTSTSTSIEEE